MRFLRPVTGPARRPSAADLLARAALEGRRHAGRVSARVTASATAHQTARRVARRAAGALAAAAVLALCAVAPPMGDAASTGVARIHLVWTNDIHGHVAPEGANFMNPNFPPPLGGGASAMAYVQKLREQIAGKPDEAMVLVDAGDVWQGAPVGTLTEGSVMETYFNTMRYDAVAPGNHEFDRGKDVAIRISHGMHQKFLCCNLFKQGTDSLVDWVEPCRVVERAGLRIGIIGAVTPGTAQMAFEENIKGLAFGALLPAIEKYRDDLKQQQHADIIVLVVHEGLPFDPQEEWANLQKRVAAGEDIRADVRGAMDLVHVLEGVPLVVGGHTHRGYREPWIDPVTHAMVFESFGNGSSVGHAILTIDRATGLPLRYESPRRDGVLVTLFEDEWWPSHAMTDSLRPYIQKVAAGLSVRLGRSRVELTRRGGANSPMGNFVTDAMREGASADFAFTNNGGLRTDLPAGPLTSGDMLRVEPFGNALVVVQMDGRLLRQILERKSGRGSAGICQSGANVVVDPDAAAGQRVLALTVGGLSVQPDHIYRVATTDYLMEGNSGLDFLAQVPPDRIEYTMMPVRDALTRYLQRHSPIAPAVDDRWIERPGGPRAPYLEGWEPQ
jgi:5'-nucleotidase/UDP-sugar diphosphatase